MKITQNLVPTNKYSIKCPHSMTPQFVVIHNTANDASAEAEISYMCRNNNEVSFHYAVDDREVVQGIPESRNGWHAGDGGNGRGNRYGIAIEICYSKSGGPKFDAAEKNAAELTADILRRYGWGIEKVTKHQDYSGKYCPHRTLDLGWQRYLDMVSAALGAGSAAPDTSAPSTAVYKVGDMVIVTGYPCATAAGEKPGARLAAYRGKITRVHGSGTHRYHVDAKGWCRAADLQPAGSTAAPVALKAGDRVRVKQTATTYATGQTIPAWVKGRTDTVLQAKEDRLLLRDIYSWVLRADVERL